MIGNVIQPNGAVSGGGETYSSTETVIGIWMGKTLYGIVVDFGTLPNNTSKTVSTSVSSSYKIKQVIGTAIYTNDASIIPIPFSVPNNDPATILLMILKNGTTNTYDVQIQTGMDRSSFSGTIVIKYTKS